VPAVTGGCDANCDAGHKAGKRLRSGGTGGAGEAFSGFGGMTSVDEPGAGNSWERNDVWGAYLQAGCSLGRLGWRCVRWRCGFARVDSRVRERTGFLPMFRRIVTARQPGIEDAVTLRCRGYGRMVAGLSLVAEL
jgi:hypothetical protein